MTEHTDAKFNQKMGLKFQWVFLGLIVHSLIVAGEFFKPFNVSYDGRAMIIDGKRRMLISGGIHYPRATPEVIPSAKFCLLYCQNSNFNFLFEFRRNF